MAATDTFPELPLFDLRLEEQDFDAVAETLRSGWLTLGPRTAAFEEAFAAHLGARLLPWIGFYGGAPALSPSQSPTPSVPVFLLHGTDDNVIPAIESEYLANRLRAHTPVRLLLSGLISHAEADRPVHVGDVLELAGFWGDLLNR